MSTLTMTAHIQPFCQHSTTTRGHIYTEVCVGERERDSVAEWTDSLSWKNDIDITSCGQSSAPQPGHVTQSHICTSAFSALYWWIVPGGASCILGWWIRRSGTPPAFCHLAGATRVDCKKTRGKKEEKNVTNWWQCFCWYHHLKIHFDSFDLCKWCHSLKQPLVNC